MHLDPLPAGAAWRHTGAREGFEVTRFERVPGGFRLEGHTAAVDGSRSWWSVGYELFVDQRWRTREAQVRCLSASGTRTLVLEGDGSGGWLVDGSPRPDLDGLLDVDLESSACTNTLPLHRLGIEPGDEVEAPAVWVRARDLRVEVLGQRYRRLPDDGGRLRFDYRAPELDFEAALVLDPSGLVIDYPAIATRAL